MNTVTAPFTSCPNSGTLRSEFNKSSLQEEQKAIYSIHEHTLLLCLGIFLCRCFPLKDNWLISP